MLEKTVNHFTLSSPLSLSTLSQLLPLSLSQLFSPTTQPVTHPLLITLHPMVLLSLSTSQLSHSQGHNPLISLAPLAQPISLTHLAQPILHRCPPTDRHHPPSSALPSFITVSSLHKPPLLFSLAPSLGSDWQAVVLGFWWLLQSCLCLDVQIRFFIRGFFFFFIFLGFWFGFMEGFFGFLIWIFGCWWLVAVF